jgi:hypothetical protein
MKNEHHVEESDVIIENVKIDKIVFVETYTHKQLLELP